MKLATLENGKPDGRLIVVSKDGSRYEEALAANTLQEAVENWSEIEADLQKQSSALNEGGGLNLDLKKLRAPLPRAWQWLDGSVFPSHGELMDKALNIEPEKVDRPLMYQGVSDTFFGPYDDIPMASDDLFIDFEGEIGIITDRVPAGTSVEDAADHVKLVVQINDWSLRALAGVEMRSGFGWIQAKPPCAMAPFAITPDELGDLWKGCQLQARLAVDWNGERFGNAHAGQMAYGFDELIAHAALTRNLVAGTVIGSGTVSNADYREVGSSCIAERRGIEVVDTGKPQTDFMKYGDTVRMEARGPNDEVLFGVLDQKVVKP